MKKIIYITIIVIIALALVLYGLLLYTKSFSPFATATFNESGLDVKIEYCQPKKKGREIFGKVVPFDKVWRTGANSSTTITFGKDTKIAGKEVKKGAYSLFTIPKADKWIIIINNRVGDWGAFSYNQEKDALRVEVPSKAINEAVEMFTIKIERADQDAQIVLTWDKTQVNIPISK